MRIFITAPKTMTPADLKEFTRQKINKAADTAIPLIYEGFEKKKNIFSRIYLDIPKDFSDEEFLMVIDRLSYLLEGWCVAPYEDYVDKIIITSKDNTPT